MNPIEGNDPIDDPMISDSSLNPGVSMTRDGVDFESDTRQRTTLLERHSLFRKRFGKRRRDQIVARNMDIRRHELLRKELLAKASMGTLEPPEDKSIKTLLVRGLNPTISEQDIRDQLGCFEEIESIRFLAEEGCAFVTYTSREEAEKATQELSKWLVINGQRLKLAWARPELPISNHDSSNQAVGPRPPTMSAPMKLLGRSREFTVPSTSEHPRASSSSSSSPMICGYSSLKPGVGMIRDGVDSESDTLQRTTPLERQNLSFPKTHGRNMLFRKRHETMASQNIDIHHHDE